MSIQEHSFILLFTQSNYVAPIQDIYFEVLNNALNQSNRSFVFFCYFNYLFKQLLYLQVCKWTGLLYGLRQILAKAEIKQWALDRM